MSLLFKTFGIFFTFGSASVAPLAYMGEGLSFQWVSYSDFKENWGGEAMFRKHRPITSSYDEKYANCKVAVNWYYSDWAFLFKCDGGANYYTLDLIKKLSQKEKDLFQKIIQDVKRAVLSKHATKEDYMFYSNS